MEKKISIIIQARLSSKRFPGKVLHKIGNKTIIEILIDRLNYVRGFDDIIFVIPNNKKNYKLYKYLKNIKKIKIFRGSENNVLSRYFNAAKKFNSDIIVRITADCPLIDPLMLTKIINYFKKNRYDYISNVRPRSFPDGLDIEVFNFKTLKYAFVKSKTKIDKEHVTKFMIRSKKISKYNFKNKINFSKIRWTIDFKEDLLFIRNFLKNYSTKKYLGWKKLLTLYNNIKI
tara:strand:- start:390 stop:1079 length:690 start_codon:yes stop_codon:yes gene_type:complete